MFNISDTLCCYSSYHTLLELHPTNKWNKTAAAKRQVQREGISVRVAEWHLDADLFLDEYPRWEAGDPQCPYHLQAMFVYAKAARWKEYEQAIHQGHQQSSPGLDTEAEVPAIQLIEFKTNSTMKFINSKVHQAPYCVAQRRWRVDLGNPQLSERASVVKMGFHPARGMGSYQYFEVRPPSRALSEDASEGQWLKES